MSKYVCYDSELFIDLYSTYVKSSYKYKCVKQIVLREVRACTRRHVSVVGEYAHTESIFAERKYLQKSGGKQCYLIDLFVSDVLFVSESLSTEKWRENVRSCIWKMSVTEYRERASEARCTVIAMMYCVKRC